VIAEYAPGRDGPQVRFLQSLADRKGDQRRSGHARSPISRRNTTTYHQAASAADRIRMVRTGPSAIALLQIIEGRERISCHAPASDQAMFIEQKSASLLRSVAKPIAVPSSRPRLIEHLPFVHGFQVRASRQATIVCRVDISRCFRCEKRAVCLSQTGSASSKRR